MIKNNYKISIIIPAYNCQNSIKKCVMSFVEQTYRNLEIIIIDDGSTDNTYIECNKIKDNRIILVKNSNNGVSHARNVGLKIMSGDYFLFCDSDDYVDNNAIENLVKNIKDDVLIRIAYKKENINGNIYTKKSFNMDTNKYIYNILCGREEGFCWGYLFDYRIAKNLEFNENTSYLEDTIFLISYLLKIQKIIFVNDSFYHYTQNIGGISSPKFDLEKKIYDVCYSIEVLYNLINKRYSFKEYRDLLDCKKIIIINYLCQNISYSEMDTIFREKNIYDDLKKINLKKLSLNDKLFVKIVLSKNAFLFSFYKIMKKNIKKIQRRI